MKKFDKEKLLRVLILVGSVVLGGLIGFGVFWLSENIRLRDADPEEREIVLPAAAPGEGVGRVPEAARYLGGGEAETAPSLEIACELDDPLPEWWDPDSAVLMWSAEPKKDIGSPDWNLDSSLVGWDGRLAEEWELELLARVFMREFWGTSLPCCEAGCDSILNLWASGLYGDTLGESLSAKNDFGKHVYSVYPRTWEGYYDPDGLEWCRAFVRERFLDGPKWTDAMYFQLYGYHDPSWTVPLYEIDGVFFSAGR